MSRNIEMNAVSDKSFPRVSGDEPDARISPDRAPEFSPRERG